MFKIRLEKTWLQIGIVLNVFSSQSYAQVWKRVSEWIG